MILNLPIEEICKKYLDGMSSIKLAKEYNCSVNTILRRLCNNGIIIRSYSESKIGLQTGEDNYSYINLPIEEICRKYQDGINSVELAKEYNCSYVTIIKRLRDNDIKIRSRSECHIGLQTGENHPHYINLPIEEICRKYQDGMNTIEIAKIYECSPKTIIKRLNDNGVKIRSPSELEYTLECRQRISAAHQGIPYEEWENFLLEQKYCLLFSPRFKEKIRIFYNRRCFMCGKSEEENGRRLDVHHVNYDKDCLCGSPCDFVTLCRSCHGKTGSNRKYWEDLIMNYLYPERYFMVEI